MSLTVGVVLLIIGVGLVLAVRPNRQGKSLIGVTGNFQVVYPAVCLVFLAYGVLLIVTSW